LIQLLANGIVAGSAFALVGLGFALVYNTTKFFHFAHGALYTLGAYLALFFWQHLGWPPLPSGLLAVLLTGAVGWLFGRFVFQSLRWRQAGPLICLLASLGTMIALQNLIALLAGEESRTLRRAAVIEGFDLLGARITQVQAVIALVCAGLYAGTWWAISYTRMGRSLRAVANDVDLATVVGVNTDRAILLTFVAGAGLAAVAGILVGCDTDLTPAMGFQALLMGVVAVVCGGLKTIVGAAVGGLFIGIVQSFGVAYMPTQWKDAIVFTVLILFLIFRPLGILGSPLHRAAK